MAIGHAASAATNSLPDKPPKLYIDKGGCPVKCCHYGQWKVKDSTNIYSQPMGKKVIGRLAEEETFTAITGNVYIHPTQMTVIFSHGPFKAGDTLYMLDDTPADEGICHLWFHGTILTDDFRFLHDGNVDRSKPSAANWVKVADGHYEDDEENWWVKVLTTKGLKGWINTDDLNIYHLGDCG